jgi:hypothetical protein
VTAITNNSPFVLGSFSVDPSEYSLQANDDNPTNLPAKSVEVLCYLAQHFPRVIAREELIDKIWLGNKPVGDKSLTNEPGREIYPVNSPDGRWLAGWLAGWLAYIWVKIDHSTTLYLQDLHNLDTSPKQLIGSNAKDYKPLWSKDNQSLYFTSGNDDGIWHKNLLWGEATQLLNEQVSSYPYRWTISQNQRYFQQRLPQLLQVNRYDLHNNQTTPLISLSKRTLDGWGTMTFIGQTQDLLLSQTEFPQVDLKSVQINL